ncbi:MFS transporter [Agrobacterium leguminum]|uniref:MFS transporter n=1 Tax=Rhizobiaceae TaxID=82115 RepID=UPI00148FEEC0|nr:MULTISPECIES: MFS transporter [Rhizobiaceae]MCZ7934864.1 MFS transporter [Agrobacterium leguminum]MCZ7976999.1 MFS transporter [Agrobacterium salinitolerans]NOV19178.1 MFS transporter [Ensifer canadensis]NTA35501.1 MFS transporter [Agrobacterium salinitolerans]
MSTSSAQTAGDVHLPTTKQVHLAVLFALGVSHLCNDTIQSIIPAVYPLVKSEFSLDFVQIGIITLVFQIAGALFQPAIGLYTDRHPLPYSAAFGMLFTTAGLLALAYAPSYPLVLVAVTLIGIGSSIFHPEATRAARYASGGRQGLAQGIFQVGGQIGGALGPLAAAFLIVSNGRQSAAAFTIMVLIAICLLVWTARQSAQIKSQFDAYKKASGNAGGTYPRRSVIIGMGILTVLMASKLSYLEGFRSFYTFYLIDRFNVSVETSQLMLFVFFISSAVGVLLGGLVGDRIGRYRIIWISILGPLPFTLLLPFADFFWTGVLTVVINLLMASAFASIMIYAMELVPTRIGLIGGLFYGLNFAIGGVAAALLGAMADRIGIEGVYSVCSFLPAVGVLAIFLPRLHGERS